MRNPAIGRRVSLADQSKPRGLTAWQRLRASTSAWRHCCLDGTWRVMRSLGNRLRRGNDTIDHTRIRRMLERDLPDLKRRPRATAQSPNPPNAALTAPMGRGTSMNDLTESSGLHRFPLARRGLVMTSLISGFTLATTRVEAQAIKTDT